MYDLYQLPKALGIVLTVYLSLGALFLYRGPFKITAPVIFLSLYYIFISSRLLWSQAHPAFFYGLIFFTPLFFFSGFYAHLSRQKLLFFLNIIFTLALGYGIFQFSFSGINRPYSFFGNPIFFGEFIAALLPFIIYSAISGKAGGGLAVFNLALAIPVIIICSSRGVVLSLGIALVLLAYYFYRAGVRPIFTNKIKVFLVLAVCFPFLIPGFFGAFSTGVQRTSHLFSSTAPEISNRLLLTGSAADIFFTSPIIGAGAGAIKQFQQEKGGKLLALKNSNDFVVSSFAHNDYMQLLAETGTLGLLLYIAFIFSLALAFEKASAYMKDSDLLFSSAIFCSLVFFFCESFFNFPLFSMPSASLLFALAGLLVAQTARATNTGFELAPLPRYALLLLLLLPLVLYFSFSKPKALVSNFYLKAAVQNSSGGFTFFEKALSLEQDNFSTLTHYAQGLSLSDKSAQAITTYENTLKYFPNSADVLYNIGALYLFQNNAKAAVSYFNRALILYPGFVSAQLGLYKSKMRLGLRPEALPHLEAALRIDANAVQKDRASTLVHFWEVTP